MFQSCTHNTQGAYCEECAFGYYGNATDATPGACRPCACPLPVSSNNFAQGCVATPGSSQGEYMCIECPEGYMGNFCEMWVYDSYHTVLIITRTFSIKLMISIVSCIEVSYQWHQYFTTETLGGSTLCLVCSKAQVPLAQHWSFGDFNWILCYVISIWCSYWCDYQTDSFVVG